MKRLYKLWHEFDDENTCIAIVANSAKGAMQKWSWEFDYIQTDLDWKDYTFWQRVKRLKDIDATDLELWYLDPRKAILLWVYYKSDQVGCDSCWKWYWMSTLSDDWEKITCRDCEKKDAIYYKNIA